MEEGEEEERGLGWVGLGEGGCVGARVGEWKRGGGVGVGVGVGPDSITSRLFFKEALMATRHHMKELVAHFNVVEGH